MMVETKNAKIVNTTLGHEGGVISFSLTLDYGTSIQTCGGYRLDAPYNGKTFGIYMIKRVLDAVGVGTWEELKGGHVRASILRGQIIAIGHLLENDWLCFEDFVAEYNPTEAS